MIDGIRRRLKSIDRDLWDTNQELEPEIDDSQQVLADKSLILEEGEERTHLGSNEVNATEHYRGLLRTAIEHGGRHGNHQISIPWLRMTLAGLELRHIEPEMMWYGIEPGTPGTPASKEIPAYDDLFPSAETS